MVDLKLLSIPQDALPEKTLYLSKGSSTAEKNAIYSKGTASCIAHEWMPQKGPHTIYDSLYTGQFERTIENFVYWQSHWGLYVNEMSYTSIESKDWFAYREVEVSGISSTQEPKPILSDEILIVPLRQLSYEDGKKEILEYLKKAGDKTVYVSELAEELRLDFELIEEILEEIKYS